MTDPPRARAVLAPAQQARRQARNRRLRQRPLIARIPPRLPINVLKIDKSFVKDGRRQQRRRTRSFSHRPRTQPRPRVVAEGVETEEAKRHLEILGCDTLQGFHLGRPKPPRTSRRSDMRVASGVRPASGALLLTANERFTSSPGGSRRLLGSFATMGVATADELVRLGREALAHSGLGASPAPSSSKLPSQAKAPRFSTASERRCSSGASMRGRSR